MLPRLVASRIPIEGRMSPAKGCVEDQQVGGKEPQGAYEAAFRRQRTKAPAFNAVRDAASPSRHQRVLSRVLGGRSSVGFACSFTAGKYCTSLATVVA
jgi:hypothetical protein